MRYLRYISAILLVCIISIIGILEISALNTEITTEKVPTDKIADLSKNVGITVITEEPTKKPIEYFDVNEAGLIAVGYRNSTFSKYNTICIYDNDGTYLYGYEFISHGSCGVEFNGDITVIYFVRGDMAISVASDGEIVDVVKIKNDPEEYRHWSGKVMLKQRQVGDTKYTIKNDFGFFNFFLTSYSKLVAENSKGEVRIIYDVTARQLTSFICSCAFILFIVLFVVFNLIILIRKSQEDGVCEKYDMENIIERMENKFKHKK